MYNVFPGMKFNRVKLEHWQVSVFIVYAYITSQSELVSD